MYQYFPELLERPVGNLKLDPSDYAKTEKRQF